MTCSSRERVPACLFCRIVAGEIPSARVAEGEGVVAIRDIAPQAPTHVLILSRDHLPSAADLDTTDGPLLAEVFRLAASIATSEGMDRAGYRIVTNVGRDGGQTVDHLHFHLLGGRAMTWPPG